MPKQVPMGTKSQVSGSLWTVLMMDKAGLFIAYAALGLKTKKSSYFELTLQPGGRNRNTSAWDGDECRKMCEKCNKQIGIYKLEV